MKQQARAALETAILGRPIRKILWILFRLTEKMHQIAAKLLHKHPYIQRVNRMSRSTSFSSNLSIEPKSDRDGAFVRYYGNLKGSIELLPYKPKISVIIPVYKVRHDFLKECLGSLAAQVYQNWEACIVDDCSEDEGIDEILQCFQKKYSEKVRYMKNESNLHISLTSNRALSLATGDYVAFLDHDDRFLPNALGEVVRFINLHDKPDILYSDECIIDEKGYVIGTYHKPDWSPMMHLSVNYTTHLSTYRRELLLQIGGCRKGFEGAQDHDVMLRACEHASKPVVHIPINLYQWRSHSLSTASDSNAKPYAGLAGVNAVSEACIRRGFPATVTFEPRIHHYKVQFQIKGELPLVSIIILSKDGFELLKPCLQSIFEKTLYKSFEVVLIDHESQDPRCFELLDNYSNNYPDQFRRIPYVGEFNFAAMNNLGSREARGKYLVLLNNDTEVITPNWLDDLLSYAQLPEVGAVGPKLLYPNGNIQHAGVLGLGPFIAGHAGLNEKAESLSYFAYYQTTHEVLGVTGACLMVEAAKYISVGGLEEVYVPNGFGDVDFCLKLRKKGYVNVYVPYAELTHKESYTRKVSFELFEKYYMLKNWSSDLLLDPYRNTSLELGHHFRIYEQNRIQEPSSELFSLMMSSEEM